MVRAEGIVMAAVVEYVAPPEKSVSATHGLEAPPPQSMPMSMEAAASVPARKSRRLPRYAKKAPTHLRHMSDLSDTATPLVPRGAENLSAL